jgi:hypothetical protein
MTPARRFCVGGSASELLHRKRLGFATALLERVAAGEEELQGCIWHAVGLGIANMILKGIDPER